MGLALGEKNKSTSEQLLRTAFSLSYNVFFFLASVVLFNGFRVEHGRWAVDLVNSDWNSSFQTATNPKGHLVERCLWCAGMCWEFPQHWRDTSARLPGRSG